MLRATNEQLGIFNAEADLAYANLSARFADHARTLGTLHADLMTVFKQVGRIKQKILRDHPELKVRRAFLARTPASLFSMEKTETPCLANHQR